MSFLDQIKEPSCHLHDVAKELVQNSPVILYGAGGMLISTITELHRYNITPSCICDDNPIKKSMYGLPVYTYEEMKNKYSNYYIFISNLTHSKQIYDKLTQAGETRIVNGFFANDIYDTVPTTYDFVLENIDSFQEVYDSLADSLSKQTLINLINFKISGYKHYLVDISQTSTYFNNDVITLSDDEVFVDAGAFNGDTMIDFISATKGVYKEIIVFEPEEENLKMLYNTAQAYTNVTIHPIGLWHKKDVLKFTDTMGECSTILANGTNQLPQTFTTVNTDALDNVIDKRVTFIKMDIEGAEVNAIKGANKLIKKYKPKLAICLYHRRRDVLDVLLNIKEIVPGYQFYLRHCSGNNTDTILYGVYDD